MEKNEHLTSKELLSFKSEKDTRNESELTREDAETVFAERMAMLHSVKNFLSPHLREAIAIKIEHERKALFEMVEADAQAIEAHQKRNKILDFTYFKKKPLNLKRI